ncbi:MULTISPECIES: S9 family peptidase [unclassified Rhodococcus (in: high G+C Gram-positive bacteria)]|uniref:S9 family peptidase n=1 Tax=unclassified Rhodococcus (in: high G+C Gram-positive bacteria) TaxID=192944 RepID=UPI00163B1AF3|nr:MULTISPECIES: S9 family peptidase [unclassified Rhodococcus (in: high G+C Gram-positive bacteria)]MBC2638775.1 S9 family peptidase [Rhodococcus sp. 3A]MBC2896484.1 S9 family peptidase [Rhodococcus sp. 4CII]
MTAIPELHAGTPFDDLDDYLALGRVGGLVLSPDGRRLVVAQSTLDEKATKYVTALWEIDPIGGFAARRLTRGRTGESNATFTSDGDLLFTSSRPAQDEDELPDDLWRLPARGGEAVVVARRGGGITGVRAARCAPRFVVTTGVLGASGEPADDERVRAERKEKKVSAILHAGFPIRYWDHDLGPDVPHLLSAPLDELAENGHEPALTDLTPLPGPALREADYALSDDGTFVVTSWTVSGPLASIRNILVRIDTETGARAVLVDDAGADLSDPVISPDGRRVVFTRESHATPDSAPRFTLHQYSFDTGAVTEVAPGWDRWATSVAWLPDGSGLLVTADDHGRAPIFLLRDGSDPTPVTSDDSAYTDMQVAPDGSTVFALRASYATPPHPVRIDLTTGAVSLLKAPAELPELPGTLTEVQTVAADGAAVRAWLAVPTGASTHAPVPLVLWVHGGPLGSWNTWSWRWNPWLLVARGYAVLLPDPALSTGYGQEFVERGWGKWGKAPFTDLMAITDAAVALPEIDEKRTAAMGGSFGGYMANWIAGHTDRFAAIVSHAGLWALDQFGPTTDAAWYWQREMTPEMAVENSPHLYVADIATPMLVIHGDKDFRVPIGEALRLWFELLSESGLPADDDGRTEHRFLYFPDENHWILSPQNAKVWYQVVLSFLSEHVRGEGAALPEILGH